MASSYYDSYCPNVPVSRDRGLLRKRLHVGPVNSAVGAPNTLKSTVAWFAKIDNDRLDPIWARFIESNSISPKLEGFQLRFFWLVVFWADFIPAPVLAKDIVRILLSAVIAESVREFAGCVGHIRPPAQERSLSAPFPDLQQLLVPTLLHKVALAP